MSAASPTIEGRSVPRPPHRVAAGLRHMALRGSAILYLGLLVVLPVAAVITKGFGDGFAAFQKAMSVPGAVDAVWLTLWTATAAALINAVMGTVLAWVMVRYRFPGKRVLATIIDLPAGDPDAW